MFDTIIVQAGGKGTRMQHLTRNKPKALVPINNLPMIFHLFRKYPDKRFVIIGDYKCDVLERYLSAFADVEYCVVNAGGKVGTCGGLNEALEHIMVDEPFMLIWSDLILNEGLDLSEIPCRNYVGCSLGFECRWKYEGGVFEEERSSTCGVAGMFIFEDKSILDGVPEEGEFVRWLSTKKIDFGTIVLDQTKEYGLLSEYNKLQLQRCRPFNRITVDGNYIIKEAIDAQGKQLAKREIAWYEKVKNLGFSNLPIIYALEPLKLEKINGKNIYEYGDLEFEKKKDILIQLVNCLTRLHKLGMQSFDEVSYKDAYIDKTFARLEKVKELVPFANDEYVVINGRRCRNVFFYRMELREKLECYKPETFVFLHGDCTFSNMMLRDDLEPVLIDPRGYFGKTELYGDAAYDWAKLYYSVVGNYDQFNLKRFQLEITGEGVTISVSSSGWEDLEGFYFELLQDEITPEQVKLIHSIIWLSLTTYAWEDYDSICGAFYLGLYYLEEVL